MDQAASVISLAGSALYVSFFPKLSAETIPLPGSRPDHPTFPAATLVCANSLVVSDKAVHAKYQYNLRVVESLGAARVLAVRLGVKVGPRERVTLREVMARFMGEPEDQMEENVDKVTEGLERMVQAVECLRPEGAGDGDQLGVTLEMMIEWSGMGEALFKDVYLSWVEGRRISSTLGAMRVLIAHSRDHVLPIVQAGQALLFRSAACAPIPQCLSDCGKITSGLPRHLRVRGTWKTDERISRKLFEAVRMYLPGSRRAHPALPRSWGLREPCHRYDYVILSTPTQTSLIHFH